jgi:hypothetical protein
VSKKLRKSQRRLRSLEHERFRRRLKRQRLGKQRKSLAKGNVPANFARAPVLKAPPSFEIGRNSERTALLRFLRTLRQITLKRQARVTIDFSMTTTMMSCGTLLFLAEVQRIVTVGRAKKRRLIKCSRITDQKVAQVLHQIGFFDAIGRMSKISPTAKDVIHWRAVAGTGADGEKANGLIEELRDRLPPSLSSPMYAGLVEAMTNCRQHAYLRNRRDGLGIVGNGEWWLFAKEEENELSVVICDLGIGIPNSLPLTQESDLIREAVARLGRTLGLAFTDSDLVQAAIELGRSRTRDRHRGKGLRDVLDVITKAGVGHLRIYSNRGCYTYRVRDNVAENHHRNYRHSILGTVIQWAVPINMELSHERGSN